MLSSLKHYDAEREEGFTLIELLVVVIIIGILAAIAIPVFLAQRERAWNSEAQSDLRNAAIALETYYTDNGNYGQDGAAGDANTGLQGEFGFNESPNMVVTVEVDDQTNAQAYCIIGNHDNLDDTTELWFLGQGESGGALLRADQSNDDGTGRAGACPDVPS